MEADFFAQVVKAHLAKFFAVTTFNGVTFSLAALPTLDTMLKLGQILLVVISCGYTVYLWRKVRLEIKNLKAQKKDADEKLPTSTPPGD